MKKDLKHHGIRNVAAVHWNLPTSALYEKIVNQKEGLIAHLGPVVVRTGAYTGRSPGINSLSKSPPAPPRFIGGKKTSLFPRKNSISSITGCWLIFRARSSSSRTATPGRTGITR